MNKNKNLEMKYLVETVRRLMAQNELSQGEVATKADMLPSHFSHILNGKQMTVAVEDIPKIARALSSAPAEQAEVVHAYVLDHLPKHFEPSAMVKCELETVRRRAEPPAYRTIPLAPEVEEALERIRACIPHDPDLRKLVLLVDKLVEKIHPATDATP